MKAGRRHEHHAADAARRRCAAGLGDTLHCDARRFRFQRAAFEFGGRRHRGVEQIEIWKLARQQRRIGEADIVVIRRDARHRHRALGELCDAIAADIVGGDHRLPLADQHAQADIVAFGALGFLDAAVAHLDALRDAAHRDRVRGIRAGAPRRLDETLREIAERRLIQQAGVGGARFFCSRIVW